MYVKKKDTVRSFLILLLIVIGMIFISGCGKQTSSTSGSDKYETVELRYQGSVNNVTFPELAEDLGYLSPVKLKWIGNTTSGPQDIQSAVTGDVDFGGAFNGAVAKLKAAKAPIKQVTLVALPPVNTEQALRQKQIDVAVLGGILRDKALERGGIHPLFSDYDLFGEFTAGSYVMTEKFLKQNPNTAKKFVEATAKAIEWARTTPREEVIARYEKIIKQRGRNEDTSNIQYWKSTGVAGNGGVIADKEFSVWIDWLIKDGQLKKDQIKSSDLYTNEFNPFQK